MIEILKEIFMPEDISEWLGLLFVVILWATYVKLEVIDKRVWKENKLLSVLLFIAVYIISLVGYQVIKMIWSL